MTDRIPFFSLEKMHADLGEAMKNSFLKVLEESWFILGRNLEKFESVFTRYIGATHGIGVGNGLDALKIAIRALGLQPGEKIIIPAMTFSASVLAALENRLDPLLVDVDPENCLINADLIGRHFGRDVKAVMPVHLYGNPCEMENIMKLSDDAGLFVIEDFAQSVGASYAGKKTGSFGKVNATSFYPVKPLGALGDGGMIITGDKEIYEKCRMLRNYGYSDKYTMEMTGYNSRLDELQAALLLLKMDFIDKWKQERQRIHDRYIINLSGLDAVRLPKRDKNSDPSYHIFPLRLAKREELKSFLEEKNITTQVHYPVPPHLQPAFAALGYKQGDFPVTEEICRTELSLPIFPGLTSEQVDRISGNIHDFAKRKL